jgi:hypothetical protein
MRPTKLKILEGGGWYTPLVGQTLDVDLDYVYSIHKKNDTIYCLNPKGCGILIKHTNYKQIIRNENRKLKLKKIEKIQNINLTKM